MWGLILNALGQGLGLWQQNRDKKAAEEAQAEQRKREAFNNVLRVVGGGSPQALSAQQPVPGVNWAGAVGNMAGAVGNYADAQQAQTRQGVLDGRYEAEQEMQKQKMSDENAYRLRQDANNQRDFGLRQENMWDEKAARQDKMNWDRSPENPQYQLTVAQKDALKAKMTAGGVAKGAKPLTTDQAIGTLFKAQEQPLPQWDGKKWLEPPEKQMFSLPETTQFKIEDAAGVPAQRMTLPGDSTRDALGEATGVPEWLRKKWYGSRAVRVPATSYFRGSGGGDNGNGLGLNL